MTTLTRDQASRLLRCIEYGFADDERAEFTELLSATAAECKACCDKWDDDLEELLQAGVTVLNVIAPLDLPAWHPSKMAAQRLDMALRPFTGYVPATPEDATQT